MTVMPRIAKSEDVATVEQAVLAACLISREQASAIVGKVSPTDFEHPVLRDILQTIGVLIEEGRTPSVESLVAALGNGEIEPQLTMREYLNQLIKDTVYGQFAPWQDAVETLLDYSRRRMLASVGTRLMHGSTAGRTSVTDMAADAVHALDDVLSSFRVTKRQSYDVEDAANAALVHLQSSARIYPTTGLVDLDKKLGGWALGQLHIIAGRPGMAKSACATSCVTRAAQAGHGVAFFSLEMQKEQLGARLMTDLAYTAESPIYYSDILNRRLDDEHKLRRLEAAAARLAGLPAMIEEQRGLTLSEIAARSRKLAAAFERKGKRLEVVFVDHIGLVRASNRYAGNRVREVAEISDGLATLAKELDVAVVGLCQLNRGVEGRENKRPDLHDLRDSGAIEEDASTVVFLYRPAYYLEKQRFDDLAAEAARQKALDECRHKIEFGCSKNRNGEVGIVNAYVDIGANAIRNGSFVR